MGRIVSVGRALGSDVRHASFGPSLEVAPPPPFPPVDVEPPEGFELQEEWAMVEQLENAIISLRGAKRALRWGDLEMADSLVCGARGACDEWLMSRSIPSPAVPTDALHSFLSWEAEQ